MQKIAPFTNCSYFQLDNVSSNYVCKGELIQALMVALLLSSPKRELKVTIPLFHFFTLSPVLPSYLAHLPQALGQRRKFSSSPSVQEKYQRTKCILCATGSSEHEVMLCHKLRQTPQPGPCRNFPMEFNICHLPPLAIRVGGTASNRGQCFTFKQCRAESGLEAASFQKQKLQGGSLPLLSVF